MSSRHEVEMEKQFLADLEKAKALSLETHELEKIRKQRYSQPDPSIYSETNNLEEYKQYLQRKAQLHQAKTGATAISVAPPSSARRNSDTRNPLTNATPTSSIDQQRGRDEADLMSFNPPPPVPNPQDEAHNSLKELVDKMHRMNTQQQYEHPVYKTQRSYSVASAPTYGGYTPAYLQQQIVPNYSPASMQLVPYQQTPSDKPSKLTPDELARLYSMPTAYGVTPQPGFIPQGQYQPNAYLPHPQFPVQYAPAPTTAYIPQSQPVAATVAPPAPGFIVQPSPPPAVATIANPESALVHVPKPVAPLSKLTLANRSTSQPVQPFPPAIPGPSSSSTSNPFARNSLGATGASSAATTAKSNGEQVVLRPKSDPPAATARLGDNLIDLGPFEENSRVSVLEAFDPLLCGHRSSLSSGASEDDKDDTASTYYEDYDPFDYIYSGGTQYSDPVYEAVSRSDRTPLSPNSSGSGPPPAPGWSVSSAYGFGEPDLEMDPPPLPPRNSDLYHPMMGAVTAAAVGNEPSSSAGNYEVMQRKTIERRPAPTKLYENVVIKKSYDRELIAFYEMVKHLREQYRCDDSGSNVGHVVASEFDNHYPEGTSIKLLVHPALDCFTSYDSQNKGQIDGYGPPIPFTCKLF